MDHVGHSDGGEGGGGRRRGARSARAAVALPAGAAVWGGGGGRCQAVGSRRLGSGGARRRRRHYQADRFAPASGGPSHEGGSLSARAGLAARMERRAEPNAGGGRGRVHLSRLPRRRRTHPPGDGRGEGRVAAAGAAGPRAEGCRLLGVSERPRAGVPSSAEPRISLDSRALHETPHNSHRPHISTHIPSCMRAGDLAPDPARGRPRHRAALWALPFDRARQVPQRHGDLPPLPALRPPQRAASVDGRLREPAVRGAVSVSSPEPRASLPR